MPRKHQATAERGRGQNHNGTNGSACHGKPRQDNEFETLLADLATATKKVASGSNKKASQHARPLTEANRPAKKFQVTEQRNRSDQVNLEAKMKEQLERKLIIDRILQSLKTARRTFLDSPETSFHYSEVKDNPYFHVTVGEMQGWRAAMEDEHIIDVAFGNGDKSTSMEGLFGVMDGHTGKSCATLCSKIFSAGLHQYARVQSGQHASETAANGSASDNNGTNPLTTAVINDDSGNHNNSGGSTTCYQVIDFESAFMDLDSRIERVLKDQSGCTAVIVHVTPSNITCASVGDSRAVLCREGSAISLSIDHKPENPEEAERIAACGGFVRDNRVNGELAMSRSMGDFSYKSQKSLPATSQLVISKPRVIAVERQVGDRFVVLACDGIFDVMSNEELVAFVDERKQGGQENGSICEAVCRYCLAPVNPVTQQPTRAEGTDNMTIMIVDLL